MRGKMESRRSAVRRLAGSLACLFFALAVVGQTGGFGAASVAYAEEKKESVSENDAEEIKYVERNSDRVITDDDRFDADEDLLYYMQSLEVKYHLDEKMMESLHKVFDSAVYYIANTEMSLTELWAYVNSVKSSMESAATTKLSQTTSEFIQVADNWQTPVVSYTASASIEDTFFLPNSS